MVINGDSFDLVRLSVGFVFQELSIRGLKENPGLAHLSSGKFAADQEIALPRIWSLGIEMHEDWIEEHRHLNMEELQAGSKEAKEALSKKAS